MAELGKVTSTQMEREGRLISKHPLLVQKALVDKLGDKIQVIVAPPGTSGQLLSSIAGKTPEPVAESTNPRRARNEAHLDRAGRGAGGRGAERACRRRLGPRAARPNRPARRAQEVARC